ncbi:hypothetical protein ACFWIW_10750 [Amycolatopsis sp. NPDC058340]|uniref:hypothetical protein n=1 Tax=Amycolatopsis sp. NPDC058340 TaxID=3346453 RepID=UPI00365C87C9
MAVETAALVKLIRDTFKNIGPRGWLLAAGATVGILAMFGFREWLGPGDWAGLGQWVGGLGAFAAALVALDIARRETVHREEADAHQDFVRATFITSRTEGGQSLVISNRGPEPVTDVLVTNYYEPGEDHPRVVQMAPIQILMPMLPPYNTDFESKPHMPNLNTELASMIQRGVVFGYEYTDMRGNRWSRRGDELPVLAKRG